VNLPAFVQEEWDRIFSRRKSTMTSVPQTQRKLRLPRLPVPVIIAAVLIIAVMVTLVVPRLTGSADPLQGGTPITVTRETLIAGINATGRIEPRQEAALSFTIPGRVAEVLVAEGDRVAAGTPLIRLDNREAMAQVASARAALAQAEADLKQLQEGATPEEIAQARAQVEAARGALVQISGSVTEADIAAARARVDEARARLSALQGAPNTDQLTAARSALTEAQAALERQRSALSAAKLDAERQVFERANRLRDAQTAFAAARDNLARVESNGKDPLTGASLTDAGKRAYADAFAQAERALADAELALNQARIAYETARQNEITGLAEAEARVATAQANLDALLNPNPDRIAAARAALAQAEADLSRLLGEQRQGALAAQRANLAAAEANLARLTADPRATDLARAQARVAQAQAQLDLAQIRLDDTTLTAPFDGVVARINVAPGEQVTQGPVLTLIDVSRFKVTVTVDEVDVVRVAPGQDVEVLIDALGPPPQIGRVQRIAPQATNERNVTAYEVELEVAPGDRPLRSGMTASATIITAKRENALSVPVQAVREENGMTVVDVVVNDNGRITLVAQPVETGIRTGDRIEIINGLNEGQQVLLPGA
jgi:RND family efflux transporter MFP subunit